jgi:hypothetical protein
MSSANRPTREQGDKIDWRPIQDRFDEDYSTPRSMASRRVVASSMSSVSSGSST